MLEIALELEYVLYSMYVSMYADDSSHEVWYNVYADYMTSGYFTNWSFFYWK